MTSLYELNPNTVKYLIFKKNAISMKWQKMIKNTLKSFTFLQVTFDLYSFGLSSWKFTRLSKKKGK